MSPSRPVSRRVSTARCRQLRDVTCSRNGLLRLSPIECANAFLHLQHPLFTQGIVSNRQDIARRHFALEERGNAKVHSLSPQTHLSSKGEEETAGATMADAATVVNVQVPQGIIIPT
jgi:hypothetical protein